ncbi:hypothetical protein LCGC14_1527360 [marine sediment metagenome]|uniref:Uncharacterized protein n=1 Tax=marine sediment metagenome TaxID=412755 RepID=A0A0F9LXU3_9ZZZZ
MNIFKKSKKGIKVCRIEGKKLISAFFSGRDVKYKIGGWTKKPKKCGPLAIFDSFDAAVCFFEDYTLANRKFYLCKYKESEEKHLYLRIGDGFLRKFDLPKGTILANKVKLIEEIT